MNIENKKANKGEWSELYAFFKLLKEVYIYAADEKVNIIEDVYFPIINLNHSIFCIFYHYRKGKVHFCRFS